MMLFRRIRAGILLGAMLGMIALAANTAAQEGPATTKFKNLAFNNPVVVKEKDVPKEIDIPKEIKKSAAPGRVKWSQKRIPAFEMNAKPWAGVFAWLSD